MPVRPGLVSVIVPVFNRPDMLRQSVTSVIKQTYGRFEVIIVDDGSTDTTPAAIAELSARDSRIRSIRRDNGGPGLARETGRIDAAGEFIQYLDSDDLLLPRKFELQVGALRAHPDCEVAYGKTLYRDSAGNEIECTWKSPNDRRESMFPSFVASRWWETATPVYRSAVTDRAGPWTSLRLEEDWEYDCRIAATGAKLAFVDEFVAIHRDHVFGRLSTGGALDRARLTDRAAAHELIASHACRAGLDPGLSEVQHFARELFLLARQCGAAGLPDQAKRLHSLSVAMSTESRLRRQLQLYAASAELLGWTATGRISSVIDRFR